MQFKRSEKMKYFPDRGCVRTLRTLYVYATGIKANTDSKTVAVVAANHILKAKGNQK